MALGAGAFASAFAWVLIAHPNAVGAVWDWDFSGELDWVCAFTISHFHQAPLWNPYKCGGMPMLANPQSRVLAPTFVLQLLFGHALGLHLEILLSLAIGWAGGYWMGRILGLRPLSAVLCASLYCGSSWLGLHLAVGHLLFVTSLYLPWIAGAAWWSMTRESVPAAALAGLAIAFTLFGGGVYQVVQASIVAATIAICLSAQRRSLSPLVMLAVAGGFAAGFSAIKLIPSYGFVLNHPRPVDFSESTPLATIVQALFSRDQLAGRAVEGWGFFEVGAYVGVMGALLAAVGALSAPRATLPWLALALLSLVFSVGDFSAYSPWAIIHHLPLMADVRISPRFLITFVLAASVMAGYGVDFIASRGGRAAPIAASAMVALVIADLWLVNAVNLHSYVEREMPPKIDGRTFQQINSPSTGDMLAMARGNTGAMNCYEYVVFPTNVVGSNQPAYRGEQHLLGPGTVALLRWSPNRLTYRIVAPAPTTLVVNQNWNAGWRVAAGAGAVVSFNGLLAVQVAAGAQRLTLAYRDLGFEIGTIVSLLTAILAIVLVISQQRRRIGHDQDQGIRP